MARWGTLAEALPDVPDGCRRRWIRLTFDDGTKTVPGLELGLLAVTRAGPFARWEITHVPSGLRLPHCSWGDLDGAVTALRELQRFAWGEFVVGRDRAGLPMVKKVPAWLPELQRLVESWRHAA